MSQDVRRELLGEFLRRFDITVESLTHDVEDTFGDPHLVIVTGSILAGLGNQESDVDVYAVVDKEGLQFIPLVTFDGAARVDVRYFSTSEVNRWHDYRSSSWPAHAPVDRKAWLRYRGELESMVRFRIAYELLGDDAWRSWRQAFELPWLHDLVQRWWRIETARRAVAVRLIDDGGCWSGQRVAHRAGEAALAALECRAAQGGGSIFFGTKWLGERLRATSDDASLAELHEVLRWPERDPDHERAYAARCLEIVASLGSASPTLRVAIYPAPGVSRLDFSGRSMIHRWGIRGIEFAPALDAMYHQDESTPWWQGQLDEAPPEEVRELVRHDLAWLSVHEETAR